MKEGWDNQMARWASALSADRLRPLRYRPILAETARGGNMLPAEAYPAVFFVLLLSTVARARAGAFFWVPADVFFGAFFFNFV
jgi:hypothetical protein